MTIYLVKDAPLDQVGNQCWEYNGVVFGGPGNDGGLGFHVMWPEVTFESAPLYNPSGRDVIGNTWNVTIRSYLIHHSSAAPTAQQIRGSLYGRLQQPNKELKIERGYGIIGTSGSDTDNDVSGWVIMYGVRPEKLSIKTLNGLNGVLFLDWSFSAVTYICSSTYPTAHSFSSYWASIAWTIAQSGLQSRAVTGGYTVPLPQIARGLQTADYMRELIEFILPSGFKRTTNQWEESSDKTAMRFQIVDQQFEGTPYPAGIVAADGSFSINTAGPAFSEGTATFSASFEVAPNYHITTAPFHFITAMVATQATIRAQLDTETPYSAVIPGGITLTRGLYDSSRKFTGSATWTLTGCMKALLAEGGVWTPFPEPNWAAWAASTDSLRSNRGLAQLSENPARDIIAGSCLPSPTVSITYDDNAESPGVPGESPYTLICNQGLFTEANSWLRYDANIRVFTKFQTVEHSKTVAPSYFPVDPPRTGEPNSTPIANPAPSYSPDKLHLLESTGYPKHVIILQFVGLRLVEPPELPILVSAGGNLLAKLDQQIDTKEVGNIFGCKLWLTKAWRSYKFEGDLTKIKAVAKVSSCGIDSASNEL